MVIISRIVPVYKVEKYLKRCVMSLVNQTLKDMEIILVDDGSPDQSGKICDDLSKMDHRIQVIHKKNGGLSSARNAGIKIAQGKYIGFVDSDDDVELNMFECMVEAAEKYNADFLMSDYIRIINDKEKVLVSKSLEEGLYEKKDVIEKIYPNLIMGETVDYGPILSVWNCIYKKKFLDKNKILFAEDVRWSEDNLFNAMVGYYAKNFVYLKNKGLYHYYQNEGTITTSYRPGAWEVYKRMNTYMRDFFINKKEYDFNRQIRLHLIYYACNTIGMEGVNASNFKDAKKRISKILNDDQLKSIFHGFKLPRVSVKLRLQLLFMKHRYTSIVTWMVRKRE